MKKDYKIAVAGTGYVGLSIATLLSQHHQVTAVDIIPEKVDMINNRKSPIQDDYIEKYLAEKELKSDVLKFLLEDNCSLVVRPSGTEPKLKIYISVSAQNKELAEKVEYEIAKIAEKWIC